MPGEARWTANGDVDVTFDHWLIRFRSDLTFKAAFRCVLPRRVYSSAAAPQSVIRKAWSIADIFVSRSP